MTPSSTTCPSSTRPRVIPGARPAREPRARFRHPGALILWCLAGWLGAGDLSLGIAAAGTAIQPLPPPSNPRAVGFTQLGPHLTGVDFTNRLSAERSLQNQNLLNGSGVAAGDFDGDGLCDLYFCAIAGTNCLYRNLGNWKFQEMAQEAGVACGGWPATGATFADTDGDGDLDLLVTSLGTGVHCFRNLGNGRFRETTAEDGLTTRTGSTSLALGDIDGDGDLDLYLVNYGALSVLRSGGRVEVKQANGQWIVTGPHAHRLRFVNGRMEEVGEADLLFLNDGRGRFESVPWNSPRFLSDDGQPKPPPLDYGLGVQMRDVDGDGDPDIYVCNDFQTPDRLWINDGKGNFREASYRVMRKFPFSSMGVDFADIDGDGNLDFLVAEMASRDHLHQMRQLSGAVPLPNLPGRVDLRPQVVRNALYRSNGDGTWSDIAEYAGVAASDWSWQPVFLDVDLDGFEDLLVVNGVQYDTLDRDTLARIQTLGRQPPETARTNLLLYPPFPSPNAAFRNRGDLTFEDAAASWGFDSPRISQGIAAADLDGDGDLDLAVNCLNDGALLYRNEGSAARLHVQLRGLPPNTRGIGSRIRVIGGPRIQEQEIVAGGRYLSSDPTERAFACGTAERLSLEVRWRSGRLSRIDNVPPNHRCLIDESEAVMPPVGAGDPKTPSPAWFEEMSHRLGHSHHEEVFDDFSRQPLLPKQLSSLGPGVAWFDLDQDGREELIVGTGRGGVLAGFRFDERGDATRLASAERAPDDVLGFTAWTTGDGKPALLAAVTGYENTAPGVASIVQIRAATPGATQLVVTPFPTPFALPASLGALASCDFDGDGDLDLFVGGRVVPGSYPVAPKSSLLLNHRDRCVEEPSTRELLSHVGMVSGAAWCDLENDGFSELILAVEWSPPRIFRNQKGRLSPWDLPVSDPETGTTRALSSLSGWWTSVATGDFDGDGRQDVALGNWGRNSGYHAEVGRPLRLYFGDLAGRGSFDLIESHTLLPSGTEVPRRSLNALAQAFPFLMARFPNHREFGASSLEPILAALPHRPDSVTAVMLDSVVLLQRPSGWLLRRLPAEAQFAPVFETVVADANNDDIDDLFLAQNFFAMRVEWARADAGRGLWLRGDGQGGFAAVPARESGVVCLGEQRGAALGDFNHDGRLDLVVAQNGTTTTLWRGTGAPQAVRVALDGPPGNPAGHGAAVRARRGNAWSPWRELKSSNGYLSLNTRYLGFAAPRPNAFEVRWPGGQTNTFNLPPEGLRVRLNADGRLYSEP
ncbi:MAG: VCBS repeat-containing protein [Verrucomicrobiales bacterium]|nr:VCBS repeat-containing protein [Verrucomicrobiales bacterium]